LVAYDLNPRKRLNPLDSDFFHKNAERQTINTYLLLRIVNVKQAFVTTAYA
jgi:hypothetical protein